MNVVEQAIDEGNTFAMSDDQGAKFPEKKGDIDSGRGGDVELSFVPETADIISS